MISISGWWRKNGTDVVSIIVMVAIIVIIGIVAVT